jgi:hypothetical protein
MTAETGGKAYYLAGEVPADLPTLAGLLATDPVTGILLTDQPLVERGRAHCSRT